MKQFKKPSLYRPIIKELSNQQNPGNYNFVFHIYIYIYKSNFFFRFSLSFLDSQISSLQAITLNEYDSALETKDSVKNITENESVPIKTQIANYKTVKELIDISPNSIKSLENIQHTTNLQEFLIKKDFLNEMKSVFNSETFKIISNNKTVSSNKSTENNDINNSNIQQESQIFISPKHNKSVLKSTTGSTNSLIKKKVIFDLTNKKDKESYFDDDKEKKELCENNWNTLRYVKINDIFL